MSISATSAASKSAAAPNSHEVKKQARPHVVCKMAHARSGAKTHSSRLPSHRSRTMRSMSKKIACDQIYRQTVAIDQLVEDEDKDTLVPQLAASCSLLAQSGEHLSDMCNGPHTRKAIGQLIADFQMMSADRIAKGEFHQVAALCANFSAGLDDIIGVKRKF